MLEDCSLNLCSYVVKATVPNVCLKKTKSVRDIPTRTRQQFRVIRVLRLFKIVCQMMITVLFLTEITENTEVTDVKGREFTDGFVFGVQNCGALALRRV